MASQLRGQSGEWTYLELPLVRLHPPQPDLIFLELAGGMTFLMLSLLPVIKSPCSLSAFVGSRINLDITVRARY